MCAIFLICGKCVEYSLKKNITRGWRDDSSVQRAIVVVTMDQSSVLIMSTGWLTGQSDALFCSLQVPKCVSTHTQSVIQYDNFMLKNNWCTEMWLNIKLEIEYSFQNKTNQSFFFFLSCSLLFTTFTFSPTRYLAWNSWGNWHIGCDHQCIRNCYYIWLHPTFCLWIQIWPLCKSREAEWEVRSKFIYIFFQSIL